MIPDQQPKHSGWVNYDSIPKTQFKTRSQKFLTHPDYDRLSHAEYYGYDDRPQPFHNPFESNKQIEMYDIISEFTDEEERGRAELNGRVMNFN